MNSIGRMLISVAISALLPATVMAQKVSYDYNAAQDFTRLKTYTFKDCTKTEDPFVDERIAAAVAGQLEARGMTRDDVNPDVYVTTRQTFEKQKEYQMYSSGYPYGWGWGYGYGYWWGPEYTDVRVKDIIVGTLTVDLKDSSNDQLVWRGVGVRKVHPLSKPSHVNKRVNKQVTKIFRNYPPN